jgi:hypothetical protein
VAGSCEHGNETLDSMAGNLSTSLVTIGFSRRTLFLGGVSSLSGLRMHFNCSNIENQC